MKRSAHSDLMVMTAIFPAGVNESVELLLDPLEEELPSSSSGRSRLTMNGSLGNFCHGVVAVIILFLFRML